MDEQGNPPDNVRPLMQTHQCASCGATVEHAQRFELSAHKPECRQPEIRMRRAEAEIELLRDAVSQLIDNVQDLNRCVAAMAAKETHGNSEASPDTQRSPACDPEPASGQACDIYGDDLLFDAQACNTSGAHADSSAAEPAVASE